MQEKSTTMIDLIEGIARPTLVIPALSLVLAADLVYLWSANVSTTQYSWTAILHILTPALVLKTVLLMAIGQWVILPVLQLVLATLIPVLPNWMFPDAGMDRGFASIENLERQAIERDNRSLWQYVQNLKKSRAQEARIAKQIGLLLILGLLDWMHDGSIVGSVANYGWHGLYVWQLYIAAMFLYLRLVLVGIHSDVDKVYVGTLRLSTDNPRAAE